MESKNLKKRILESRIKKMFEKNGGKTITWDVKADPPIKIEISRFVYEDLPEHFKFILTEGKHIIRHCNETDLSKIASEVLKALDDIEPRRKRLHDLKDFYIQYIEGHTQDQWDLAKRAMFLVDANSGQNLEYVATSLQIPVRVALDAVKFASDINKYASKYNEIYNDRLSNNDCGKTLEENDNNIFGGVYSFKYDEEFLKEHPNAVIHDRKKIYDEVDDAMHRVVVQDVPANLVNYPGGNSKRKYAVFYNPNIIPSGSKSEPFFTLDANIPYFRLELPLSKVIMRANRNFDLILDDRKEYSLGSGAMRRGWLTYALNIKSNIKKYKNECDLNGEFPYPSVYLYDIENYIRKFEKQGESMVCVKVPYTKSSDGFGTIYRKSDCLCMGEDLELRLDDKCTVHYHITDADGRKIRMHDKCVLAEEVKASLEQFQEEHVTEQNGDPEDLYADWNEDLIEIDLKNDILFDVRNQWSH